MSHHNAVDSTRLKPAPFYVIMNQYGGIGKLWTIEYTGAGEVHDWLNSLGGLAGWETAGFLEWAETARPGEMFKSEYFVVIRALDTA